VNITRWWYSIIDSWFGITITIGIIAMVIGALVSIIKSFGQKGTSK
jgi:Ni/Fe-hydrogenase subunit HybB-like protein